LKYKQARNKEIRLNYKKPPTFAHLEPVMSKISLGTSPVRQREASDSQQQALREA